MHDEPTNPRTTAQEGSLPPDVEALAEVILDCAFDIHRQLGAGFKESVYQRCMSYALSKRQVAFVEHPHLTVWYDGLLIEDAGHPDLIVGERVVVELKATVGLHRVQVAQTINYLKASGLPLGMLINFNVPLLKEGVERLVHPDLLRKNVVGSWVRRARGPGATVYDRTARSTPAARSTSADETS